MRDTRFIAVHRGGQLIMENHRKLIIWASECSGHVLSLIKGNIDSRIIYALQTAKDWAAQNASTGQAMKASVNVHALARDSSDPVLTAIARSAGQAVATAHMADHSIGAALYAMRAVKNAGGSVEAERKWQDEHLPSELKELVLSMRVEKGKHFRI